jgi:hypothetical protein
VKQVTWLEAILRLTCVLCAAWLPLRAAAAAAAAARFLGVKGARGVLKRAGQVFPGVRQVTLTHANGWCDPVQVRSRP